MLWIIFRRVGVRNEVNGKVEALQERIEGIGNQLKGIELDSKMHLQVNPDAALSRSKSNTQRLLLPNSRCPPDGLSVDKKIKNPLEIETEDFTSEKLPLYRHVRFSKNATCKALFPNNDKEHIEQLQNKNKANLHSTVDYDNSTLADFIHMIEGKNNTKPENKKDYEKSDKEFLPKSRAGLKNPPPSSPFADLSSKPTKRPSRDERINLHWRHPQNPPTKNEPQLSLGDLREGTYTTSTGRVFKVMRSLNNPINLIVKYGTKSINPSDVLVYLRQDHFHFAPPQPALVNTSQRVETNKPVIGIQAGNHRRTKTDVGVLEAGRQEGKDKRSRAFI